MKFDYLYESIDQTHRSAGVQGRVELLLFKFHFNYATLPYRPQDHV